MTTPHPVYASLSALVNRLHVIATDALNEVFAEVPGAVIVKTTLTHDSGCVHFRLGDQRVKFLTVEGPHLCTHRLPGVAGELMEVQQRGMVPPPDETWEPPHKAEVVQAVRGGDPEDWVPLLCQWVDAVLEAAWSDEAAWRAMGVEPAYAAPKQYAGIAREAWFWLEGGLWYFTFGNMNLVGGGSGNRYGYLERFDWEDEEDEPTRPTVPRPGSLAETTPSP